MAAATAARNNVFFIMTSSNAPPGTFRSDRLSLARGEIVLACRLKLGEIAQGADFSAAEHRNGLLILADLCHGIGRRPGKSAPSQVWATPAQIVAPHRPVGHAEGDRRAVWRRRGLGDVPGGQADGGPGGLSRSSLRDQKRRRHSRHKDRLHGYLHKITLRRYSRARKEPSQAPY